MATFVGSNYTQDTNTINLAGTIAGNLLIFFYVSSTGTPTSPSGTQNDWKVITEPGAFTTVWAYWTIATSSGTQSVTMGGTGGNQGIGLVQYSGTDANGAYGYASQLLAPGATGVNCGPFNIKAGAIIVATPFGSATAYTSSSGSSNRTVPTSKRAFIADNLTVINTGYTETGTFTGSMTFGCGVVLFSIGLSNTSRTLVGIGV